MNRSKRRPAPRRPSAPAARSRRLREAETRLIESESQRLAHVGSWEWDAARNVVRWSEELYRIYGLRREEFSGTYEAFLGRVHPEDRLRTRRVIARAFREPGPFSYDHRIIRGDGSIRMLQTRGDVVRDRKGAVARMLGCCLDVTEQWETRRRLDESLDLLRATLDSTADGIFVVDLLGRLVICNQRALALWALPESLAAKGDVWKMVARVRDQLEAPEEFVEKERQLLREPQTEGYDTVRFKDGRVFERYTRPQRRDGRVVGRVCSFRDVTRRERALKDLQALTVELEERVRRRTAELRGKAEELARSNAELELFAAAASHDLSAPLRKISGFSKQLEARLAGRAGPEELSLLSRVQKAAGDMTRLVSDMLELSRASSERAPLRELDLNAVLGDALSDLEVALSQSGGSVEAGRLPKVLGHATLWRRLLENLIGNALKFRSSERVPKVVVRSSLEQDGGATISVEDNGIGFDQKLAGDIFQPFRRLPGAAGYQGSGLGLATCERIVERYGGRITVRSEPGRGSVFSIRLPAAVMAGGRSALRRRQGA